MGMDTARECQRCQYRWWGQRTAWSPKPSAILHGARANTGLDYQRRQYDAFKTCPNCGATKVRTVDKEGFMPTGAITQTPTITATVSNDESFIDPALIEKAIVKPRKMGRLERRLYEAGRRSARG